jgi:hypothetical protein
MHQGKSASHLPLSIFDLITLHGDDYNPLLRLFPAFTHPFPMELVLNEYRPRPSKASCYDFLVFPSAPPSSSETIKNHHQSIDAEDEVDKAFERGEIVSDAFLFAVKAFA